MNRHASAGLALLVVMVAVTGPGCKAKTVEVQSGSQVLCTYGEIVSETLETLQVPVKDAAEYSVETTTITCDIHLKVEELYAKAQADMAAGDLKAARAKLDELLALDPKYRNAKDQRDAIDAGETPPPPGGSGSVTPPGTPAGTTTGTPSGPVVNLMKYVPDVVPGYSAQAVRPEVLSLSRVYLPAASGSVDQLVIQAEQFKDAAQAEGKLTSEIKTQYSVASATVRVGGKDAYFGTNNRGFAVIGLSDGAALVVFEMYTSGGNAPGLKATLTAAAEAVM